MAKADNLKETDLYPPVKTYLQNLGYTVTGETAGCDVAAINGTELIAVELKRGFSLKLLSQAVDRQESCNGVYVAIPISGSSYPPNFKANLKLIKRLELGLLLVRFLKHRTRVELVCHPEHRERRKNTRRRLAILRELNGRSGDHTPGGTRGPVVTAYREEALFLALLLDKENELSPAVCRQKGASGKTAAILRDNHYGWFERVRRGVYRLNPAGSAALDEYAGVVELIKAELIKAAKQEKG